MFASRHANALRSGSFHYGVTITPQRIARRRMESSVSDLFIFSYASKRYGTKEKYPWHY